MYNNKCDEWEECLIRHSLRGASVSTIILAGQSPGVADCWCGASTELLLSLHSQPQSVAWAKLHTRAVQLKFSQYDLLISHHVLLRRHLAERCLSLLVRATDHCEEHENRFSPVQSEEVSGEPGWSRAQPAWPTPPPQPPPSTVNTRNYRPAPQVTTPRGRGRGGRTSGIFFFLRYLLYNVNCSVSYAELIGA